MNGRNLGAEALVRWRIAGIQTSDEQVLMETTRRASYVYTAVGVVL
jgi:hypothetical protein